MTMKSVIRSIKNEINNYDEGERLVRELTSNERSPPSTQMLIKLKQMLTDTYQFPTVVRMLFKRLKDYNNIRHVEKSLICIEYLIKNADRKFVRYCQRDKGSLQKLTRYRYILGNNNGVPVDYGGNIRKRAKRIADILSNEDKLRASRAKAQGYAMQFKGKKSKSKQSKTSHSQTHKKQTRSPKQSTQQQQPKKKKVKKKKSKKPKESKIEPEEPKYESFIDMPPESGNNNANNGANNNNNNNNNDLLTGNWWQEEEAPGDNDEFAWFEPNSGGNDETGVGDDGGAFGFGNNDDFDDFNDGDNKEDDLNPDTWMTSLTAMDNVLDGSVKKQDTNKRNKKGTSMAQMAKKNPVKQPIPNSFGTDDFFKVNSNDNNDEFDPFGLGNQNKGGGGSGSSNITSLYNSSKNNDPFGSSVNNNNNNGFGYQGKSAANPYSSDPFAGIGGSGGNNMGPTPAKYVQRKKPSDPFAQFGSMK